MSTRQQPRPTRDPTRPGPDHPASSHWMVGSGIMQKENSHLLHQGCSWRRRSLDEGIASQPLDRQRASREGSGPSGWVWLFLRASSFGRERERESFGFWTVKRIETSGLLIYCRGKRREEKVKGLTVVGLQ